MKTYVLTGGPGSGKSSIILGLERQGEYVIREAAEDVIRLRQAQGEKEPWINSRFQESILELQLQREAKIPLEAQRVYIDRGIADGLAYAQPESEIYKKILEQAKKPKSRYWGIMIVDCLESTEKTAVRRENHDEALKLADKLEKAYKMIGYDIKRIGQGSVEERVKEVLRLSGD